MLLKKFFNNRTKQAVMVIKRLHSDDTKKFEKAP